MSYKQSIGYNTARQFNSDSKAKKIIFIYEGCITLIKKAQQAIKNGEIESKFSYLNKVTKIIEGFRISLDFEKTPELSEILNNFYAQIYVRLIKVNFEVDITKSIKDCDQIIADLEVVLLSWKEVDAQLNINQEKPMSSTNDSSNNWVIA